MSFEGGVNEKAQFCLIFKKNSDPHIDKICGGGPGPMGLDLDPTLKCQIISIYCPSSPS